MVRRSDANDEFPASFLTRESPLITSTMQDDFQLTTRLILEHGSRVFHGSEVVTWEGTEARRADYGEVAQNAGRLANALTSLGVRRGEPVGTFCWNHQEHLEAYYAVPTMGAVLHTINIRLPAQQIIEIIQHAGDRIILVDDTLAPLLTSVADQLSNVHTYVVIGDGDLPDFAGRQVLRYADLVRAQRPEFDWPDLDERAAASMCYTSGTTGSPKGVVYSHRSIVLHALNANAAYVIPVTDSDRVLTFVPMFHVNAWGIPFSAFFSGASLHLPSRYMQPADTCAFIAAERSTVASAVPTIWAGIHAWGAHHPIDLSSLRVGTSGGAAMSASLMAAFERDYGLRIIQGWGMTETSPIGGLAHPPAGVDIGSADELVWRQHAGRIISGVQMRTVDDDGRELPWDGRSMGELQVRGPWITGSYFGVDAPEKFADGWLRTGDIGTIDDRGYFIIRDRTKDVIKSGGEWISSVELENLLADAPGVATAAVIAIPDDKWAERPLACVVLETGATADFRAMADHLAEHVARWQVPENWAVIDTIPLSSVGKYDKKTLRDRYARGELVVERTRLD